MSDDKEKSIVELFREFREAHGGGIDFGDICPRCQEVLCECCSECDSLRAKFAKAIAFLEESKRGHEGHGDYCQVLNTGHCDCGAAEFNARLDAMLAELKS